MAELVRTIGGQRIPMFTLHDGLCNLTSGTYTGITMARCTVNGTITITFNGNSTPVAVPCVAGDVYPIHNAKQVVVTSGTFHFM